MSQYALICRGHLHRLSGWHDRCANLTVIDTPDQRLALIYGDINWFPNEGKVMIGRPETLLLVGDGIFWSQVKIDPDPNGILPCEICRYRGNLPLNDDGYAELPEPLDRGAEEL